MSIKLLCKVCNFRRTISCPINTEKCFVHDLLKANDVMKDIIQAAVMNGKLIISSEAENIIKNNG